MNNDHTELIIHIRRDLSRFSYPTSWSKQIRMIWFSQMINLQTRLFQALSSWLLKHPVILILQTLQAISSTA